MEYDLYIYADFDYIFGALKYAMLRFILKFSNVALEPSYLVYYLTSHVFARQKKHWSLAAIPASPIHILPLLILFQTDHIAWDQTPHTANLNAG